MYVLILCQDWESQSLTTICVSFMNHHDFWIFHRGDVLLKTSSRPAALSFAHHHPATGNGTKWWEGLPDCLSGTPITLDMLPQSSTMAICVACFRITHPTTNIGVSSVKGGSSGSSSGRSFSTNFLRKPRRARSKCGLDLRLKPTSVIRFQWLGDSKDSWETHCWAL